MPPIGEQGHQLDHVAVCTGHPHLPGHDLPHHLGFFRRHRARTPHQRTQAVPHTFVAVHVHVPHEVRHGDDADDTPGFVHHRQRLDLFAPHQGPRVPQGGAKLCGKRLARHDVLATQLAQVALVGGQLGMVQQGLEVVPAHVKHLVVAGQRNVQVLRTEA